MINRVAATLHLPYFTTLRLSSLLLVVLFKLILPPLTYLCVFWAVLFGHYVLAFYYGRSNTLYLLQNPRTWIPALGLLALSFACFSTGFDPILIAYFGIHHALTETYLTTPVSIIPSQNKNRNEMILSRFLVTFLIYVVLQRHYFSFSESVFPFILLATFGFFLFSGITHYQKRDRVPRSWLIDIGLYELVGLVLLCIVFSEQIAFEDIIFYHLLVWIFYPFSTAKLRNNTKQQRQYILLTVFVTLAFFIVTPITQIAPVLTVEVWGSQAFLWGYIHISTSFMLSGMNPFWISRWFMLPKRTSEPLQTVLKML